MFSIEYLAGIVDGEGHIGLYESGLPRKTYYYPRIGITNTFLPLLEEIQKQYGGKIRLKKNGQKAADRGWTQAYDLRWDGDNARNLIKELIPYLYVKKKIAIDTLFGDMKLKQ